MIENLIRLLSSKICQTSIGVCTILCSSLIISLHFGYPNLAAGSLNARERLTRRIVPEPKTVRATGNRSLTLLPSDITIVYGGSSPKAKIGAEEINKELYRLDLAKRMKIVSDEQYEAGDEKLLILTGGVGENTATKAIWEKVKHRKELNAMSDQGYIIDYVEDWRPPAVVLAGQAAIRTGKAEMGKVLGRISAHPCLMPTTGGQRLDKKLMAEFDVLASRFREL